MKTNPTPSIPAGADDGVTIPLARLEAIQIQLDRIADQNQTLLQRLRETERRQDWYSTADVAKLIGKAEYTVREWCRLGRVRAEKRACGRGRSAEWMIADAELERYRSEGLLPLPTMRA